MILTSPKTINILKIYFYRHILITSFHAVFGPQKRPFIYPLVFRTHFVLSKTEIHIQSIVSSFLSFNVCQLRGV